MALLKTIFNKLSVALDNKNTTKDTILTTISLSPILPFFIYVPLFLKKISFNLMWFSMFDLDNHRNMVKNEFGFEI